MVACDVRSAGLERKPKQVVTLLPVPGAAVAAPPAPTAHQRPAPAPGGWQDSECQLPLLFKPQKEQAGKEEGAPVFS